MFRKIFRFVWLPLVTIASIWYWWAYQARGIEAAVWESNAAVQVVDNEDFIAFSPPNAEVKEVIFYQGGLVQPEAYAPLCRKIAECGYKCLIIKMPYRLAIWGYNKPKELSLLTDTTKQYIFIGHSQGGKMVAQFAYENPELVDGLVLLGTTHPKEIDMSLLKMPVMKIYASHDGIAGAEKVLANKSKLPKTTKFALIQGGNHSQFGYLGTLLGDNEAQISQEEQQKVILEYIIDFLKR